MTRPYYVDSIDPANLSIGHDEQLVLRLARGETHAFRATKPLAAFLASRGLSLGFFFDGKQDGPMVFRGHRHAKPDICGWMGVESRLHQAELANDYWERRAREAR